MSLLPWIVAVYAAAATAAYTLIRFILNDWFSKDGR